MATNNALNNSSDLFTVTGNLLSNGLSFNGTNDMVAYTYATWVPTCNFTNGNTGITYSYQSAAYWQIGNVVYFEAAIDLSSKGSDTGNFRAISNLPVAPSQSSYCNILLGYVTKAGYYAFIGSIGTNSAINVNANTLNNADVSTITNTAINNNTKVRCAGFYFC